VTVAAPISFGAKALQILRTVAPTLALAAGGPFGPIAAAAIHLALGTDASDPKSAETALLAATPDQLQKLKDSDQAFKLQMKTLGVQEEQMAYADVAGARAMQTATRDPTVDRLAWLVIGGFMFLSLIQLVGLLGFGDEVNKIPPQGWLLIGNLSGYLAGEAKAAGAFFFGTTAGSQSKDATIADIAKSS
jgi:hypothetical protein